MVDVQDIATKLDTDAHAGAEAPAGDRRSSCRSALTKANRLIGSVNTGYGDNSASAATSTACCRSSPTRRARSARSTDLLSRHPEALIKGRTNTGKE